MKRNTIWDKFFECGFAFPIERVFSVVRNYLRIILCFFAVINSGHAAFKCKDQNGNYVYQDRSCTGMETEKKIVTSQDARVTGERTKWKIIDIKDNMTDKRNCMIKSPDVMISQNSHLSLVSIRVGLNDQDNYLVGLYTRALNPDDLGESFHNEIDGIGVKVDENSFVAVKVNSNQHFLGFDIDSGNQLVSQFLNGKQVKVRVRYWPYDRTFDGMYGIPLWDFKRALQSLIDLNCK